jgi:signal transduction histidine kinase
VRQSSEHIGFIAHEVRNPLSAARMAFQSLRRTLLSQGGRSVDILDRNLHRTADVIDSALTHVWLKMGVVPRAESILVSDFIREIELDASLEADGKTITLIVDVERDLKITGDTRLLRSAVSNLLQNALKFSRAGTQVTLRARQAEGRVLIEIEDACGGLPPGRAEELFAPTVQRADDRSGFGLGLAIALQAANAHNGTVKVRDLPGHGCIFTIDLPASEP